MVELCCRSMKEPMQGAVICSEKHGCYNYRPSIYFTYYVRNASSSSRLLLFNLSLITFFSKALRVYCYYHCRSVSHVRLTAFRQHSSLCWKESVSYRVSSRVESSCWVSDLLKSMGVLSCRSSERPMQSAVVCR